MQKTEWLVATQFTSVGNTFVNAALQLSYLPAHDSAALNDSQTGLETQTDQFLEW